MRVSPTYTVLRASVRSDVRSDVRSAVTAGKLTKMAMPGTPYADAVLTVLVIRVGNRRDVYR